LSYETYNIHYETAKMFLLAGGICSLTYKHPGKEWRPAQWAGLAPVFLLRFRSTADH
jgi:hypothetical protein